MIMKYINMKFEEHDNKLGNVIDSDPEYQEAEKMVNSETEKIDKKIGTKILDKAGYREGVSRDIAYNEGFKEGVKFILGCITNEQVCAPEVLKNHETNETTSKLEEDFGDFVFNRSTNALVRGNEKYKELMKNSSKAEDALLDKLTPKLANLFDDYLSISSEQLSYEQKFMYRQGMRDLAALMGIGGTAK